MSFTLESSDLLVQIAPKGAELTSITSKSDNTQYLWQADPGVWGRHAPILFPIVGRLKDNQYFYEDKAYSLNQHGFARDQVFSLLQHTESTLWLEASATPDTLPQYPFYFNLRIGYTLEGSTIRVTYQVGNLGNKKMPFSIGAHPGFCCPLVPGDELTDYVVEFDQVETADTHLLDDKGLFDGRTRPCLQQSNRIPITPDLFNDDALVFHGLKSSTARLLSLKSGRYVEMSIEGYPYLGIWAQPGASYVCIEPWHGLADVSDASGDIFEKKGIRTLDPNRAFECSYTITCQ